ncbi:MAG: YIP1 family protein [Saccharofermentanales bacterium]
MKKWLSYILAGILLSITINIPAGAASYKGYIYNSWDEAVPSQIGYEPAATYTGSDFGDGAGALLNPKDLFVTDDDTIYLLDSGNNRVVILDKDFKLVRILSEFRDNEEIVLLDNPTGIFVDAEGSILIADPNNQRVLVSDDDGNITRRLGKPDTDMLEKDLEFKPQKVLTDRSGLTYVTATGVYQGALLYKPDGTFDGFFGSNSVELSASLLLDRLWKGLLTDSQISNISKYIPEEFTSFDIDGKDFVYTVTQTASVTKKIKKLNPIGNNILTANKFGELEVLFVGGSLTASRFVDVSVDRNGNINVLDQQNNRVFQYDKEGLLLFVFGGSGFQSGTFQSPVAISQLGDKILVLDSKKGAISVFAKTAFGELVHQAINYYNDGEYAQSADLWKDVLKLDNNYEIAYISIGKALFADKEYKAAADYFKLGNYRKGNSDAFEAYRNQIIQRYFPILSAAILALLFFFVWKFSRKKTAKTVTADSGKMNPFKMLLHPVETAEEIKLRQSGSYLYAAIIFVLWFLATVFEYSLTGFRFNTRNPDNMNIFLLFIRTVPLFLIWVVSNWGFCTLTNGKGKMKDILVTNAYCLIPNVGAVFLNIVLSQVFVLSEGVFLQWILFAGTGWSIALLLGALSGIHEYSFTQTIISVFMTILGVLIVIFLILLVYSLVQQAYTFVYSLANELFYRYSG